jgi:hypothetical protein
VPLPASRSTPSPSTFRYPSGGLVSTGACGGLTPHERRHTTASPAASRGANVKALQRMPDHVSAVAAQEQTSRLLVRAGIVGRRRVPNQTIIILLACIAQNT